MTFIWFCETKKIVLAWKGEKIVGTSCTIDDKNPVPSWWAYSVVASVRSWWRNPIMFNDHNALIIFTEKNWQMEETTMIWLTFVRQKFPGKVIGICYNYALSHTNYILEWVEIQNEVETNGMMIVLGYIDPCLKSINQPYDVVVNNPLKQKMRGFYQEYIHYLNSQPGNKIHVLRDNLVKMIVNHLSGSTNILCPNHKSRTLSIYLDRIHMLNTNPY